MSKKILKRSLALGALMAFVITGSAYAENRTGDVASGWTLTGDYTANGIFDVYNGGDSDPKYPREGRAWNLEKYTLKVTGVNSWSNSKAAISIYNPEFTGKEGSVLQISNVDGSALEGKGVDGFGTIDVDKLIVNVTDVAIYRSDNFKDVAHNITAKVIDLTSTTDNGIYLGSPHSPLTIIADILKINAYKDGIKANSGNSATVTAGELYITATNEGRGAITTVTGGDNVSVTAKKKAIINGDITAMKNSTVSLTMNTADSEFNGAVIGYKGASDVGNVTLGLNGGTWNMTKASTLNNVTFGKDSTLLIDGKTYVNNDGKNKSYALNGVGENAKLTVVDGAKLTVTGIDKNIYNIAKGFATLEGTKVDENTTKYWDVSNLNTLMEGKWLEDTENKTLQLEVVAKNTSDMATDTGMSTSTAGLVQSIIEGAVNEDKTPAQEAAVEFIENVIANNPTDAAVGNAINNATKMGEAGGNSATAASIVKNVTGVTNDRLSFNCGHSAPHKGGHGVGLFEEGSGADIWVEYVHGKDKVEDMPSSAGATSYEGQYNGIVMGVDFKKVNKFQSGIAFNYGEGDTNSVGNAVRTHSDYDFWGVGYYGSIHNDDSNVIFDISYAQTDSDVTQNNSGTAFEANPETTTWSAGVKLEKLYQNENVQIVPYTGLRYMSIDADDYSTRNGEFYYSMDRQDIWLLPLGVSIRQEIANDNGWTVSPRVDLSYIWAFGDTNSNMEVKSPFAGVSQLGYDVMDDGSFLGLVGIEAHKGQWGYGVAYSYQKGDHSESKKWYVDVNYSF